MQKRDNVSWASHRGLPRQLMVEVRSIKNVAETVGDGTSHGVVVGTEGAEEPTKTETITDQTGETLDTEVTGDEDAAGQTQLTIDTHS